MFCQSCGAELAGAFCTRCGARAGQAPPPVQPGGPPPSYTPAPAPPPPAQQQYAPQPFAGQPLPPPAKSGSGLKILFIVLGVVMFLGMMGIGALWYGWHMVKEKAASKGIDLNALSEQRHGPARRLDACELLTKEDLSQILSLPVERSEGTGRSSHSSCRYYSSQAQQRGTDEVASAFKKLQETDKAGNSDAQQAEAMKNLGTMVRGMAGAAAASENGAVLSIEVDSNNAKAAMAGFKLALNIGAAGAGSDTKARDLLIHEVKGVADEAVFGPLASLFIFRKGDVAISIDARALPGGQDTEIAIAKRIVSKL